MTDRTRTGPSRTPVLAALAVVLVIVGAVVIGQVVRDDDGGSAATSPSASVDPAPTADATDRPDRLLVPAATETWGSQAVPDCASYEYGGGPEVVDVAQLSYECIAHVPHDASVVFSAPDAVTIGGIGWEKASVPWFERDGHQVMKKTEGDEFNLTSRIIQGVWVDAPREYAVFVGPESPAALASLEAGS